jgi:hypothetical protein
MGELAEVVAARERQRRGELEVYLRAEEAALEALGALGWMAVRAYPSNPQGGCEVIYRTPEGITVAVDLCWATPDVIGSAP